MEGQRCVEPRPFYTQRLRRPRGIVPGFEVELISTFADAIFAFSFFHRVSRLLREQSVTLWTLDARSGRRTGSKRRRNGSQNDRKRERERGGKSTAFSTGEGKEGEIFFPFLLSANNGRKVSIFPPHTHTSSLCYFPRKEKRSRQAEIISRVPLFSRSRNGERDRLAFHREKTLDQRVSRFVNRSTRCNSAWDSRGKRKSGRRRRRNGESEENGGYLLHVS